MYFQFDKKLKIVPPVESDSSSADSDTNVSLAESDLSVMSTGTISDEDARKPQILIDSDSINVGDFVLVKFQQKKSPSIYYIA